VKTQITRLAVAVAMLVAVFLCLPVSAQVSTIQGITRPFAVLSNYLIIGTNDANGARLDLEGTSLAVRNGTDTAYRQINVGTVNSSSEGVFVGNVNSDGAFRDGGNGTRLDMGVDDGIPTFRNNAQTKSLQFHSTIVPSCSSNCGTSPSVTGVDSAFTVTMGATGAPASGWVVTFGVAWDAAPSCVVQSALAGMVVGKMPIVAATTTTTLTVTTNGTAPANNDKYHVLCMRGA
jgi:hypothetical protein